MKKKLKGIYKGIIFILLVVLISISNSCKKSDDSSSGSSSTFNVDNTSIGFYKGASTKSINLTCNSVWNATISGTWASISPTMGSGNGVIKVSATANTTSSIRNCVVTITSGSSSIDVQVIQKITSY